MTDLDSNWLMIPKKKLDRIFVEEGIIYLFAFGAAKAGSIYVSNYRLVYKAL